MKIAFCYNVKRNGTGGTETELDFDSPETIEKISETIKSLGYEVTGIEADENALERLKKKRKDIDLVFNIAEGLRGDARESQISLYCELLGIPYTHSTPTVHALGLDKHLTKMAVAGIGVTVPKSVLVQKGGEVRNGDFAGLKFPVIIKPNGEGSSVGVFDDNVVANAAKAGERILWLRKKGIDKDFLTEEYIPGREFTVGLLGNGKNTQVLPIVEQKFGFMPRDYNKMAGYELKWEYEDALKDLKRAYECPAKLDTGLKRRIENTSIDIYQKLGIRDCARIDYRLNGENKLYFLEVNTLPGINPDEKVISYLPLAARTAGISFKELVKRIIEAAKERWGI